MAYDYNSDKPHQIANILDENYRTEGTDVKDPTKKDHAYSYDANGNLIYINTERPKKDGTQTPMSTERKLLWDEENRLQAIDDNGFVSNYWYDAAGERTVKTSGESQQVYVNSVFSGGDTQTADFTAYVNPYLVVSKGGQYTKHIYIGSQRIVSKLGDLDSYGSDPRRIEYAGASVDGAKVDYATKYEALQQTIKDRYAAFEVPYYGKDNDDYVNGQGFCCDDNVRLKSFSATGNDNPELFQYYYHSDHLGSSSLITNLDGEIVQHVEYVPFGEVFIEERNNTWNTPYLFNAKELDEETGLYYYGARYYDPRVSIWLSVDPIATYNPFEQENYLDGEHNGGVYNSFNLAVYGYCYQNPVKLIDPNGKQVKPKISYSHDEYIGMWEKQYGRKMTKGEMNVFNAGCVGVTALYLGIKGNIDPSNGRFPPLKDAYHTLRQAQRKAAQMEKDIAMNPDKYPEEAHVVIFSMRFWSDNKNKYQPNQYGKVDMSSYNFETRPTELTKDTKVGYTWDTFTNFDFAIFDKDTNRWLHANHKHTKEDPMTVYSSTLEYYSRKLMDFTNQIFVPAISTLPLPKNK